MKWSALSAAQKDAVAMWLVDQVHDLTVDRESMVEEQGFDFVAALKSLAVHIKTPPQPPMRDSEAYVRRPRRKRVADLIREGDDYLVVELHDGRRVRWPADGTNEILAHGSLNPENANYVPGGKVLRKV